MVTKYRTLIIDASHLAYRIYFAFPEGPIDYHMVQGFVKSLISANNRFNIEQLIVVWDRGHIFKSQLYPDYKKKVDSLTESQREDFRSQIQILEELLLDLGIRCAYKEGVEADDVIAHLCIHNYAIQQGTDKKVSILKPILILSGDHDLHPLLTEDVHLWKPQKENIYTPDSFREEFDLEPGKYHEVQALMGCSGDKVPGVRGVGPKNALNLIRKYGSLQKIKETEETDKILQKVKDNWKDVELSYQLAAFEVNIPKIDAYDADLSRVRKTLLVKGMNLLIEYWNALKELSKL